MCRTLIKVLTLWSIALISIGNAQNDQELILPNSINQFTTSFYTKINALKPKDNVICSPLSAQIALGFLSVGARGDTQKELNKALFLSNSENAALAFKPTIADLENVNGITLKIANKIFVPEGPGYSLATDFKQKAVEIFRSEVQNINFSETVKAAATINSWVESKTDSKIKNLVDPSTLSASTSIVLVNAIYFKGAWASKFNATLTKQEDFHLNSKDKVKVAMMTQSEKYAYTDIVDWNCQAVELPYEGKNASMVIIVPNDIEGLSKLEAKVATANLKEMIFDQFSEPSKLTLSIPKFKIETSMDLKSVLPELGINLIFGGGDLSGIFENGQQIAVSSVIQKAFIEVNEEGTVAAAATAIIGFGSSQPVSIVADRPFLFLIKTSTGKTLFIGRYGTSIDGPKVVENSTLPTLPTKPTRPTRPTRPTWPTRPTKPTRPTRLSRRTCVIYKGKPYCPTDQQDVYYRRR